MIVTELDTTGHTSEDPGARAIVVDDQRDAHPLRRAVAHMHHHPALAEGGVIGRRTYQLPDFAPFHRGLLENSDHLALTSLIHRRGVLDAAGHPEEKAAPHVEWEFVLRLAMVERPLAIPVVLSYEERPPSPVGEVFQEDAEVPVARRRLPGEEALAPLLPDVAGSAELSEALAGACTSTVRVPAVQGAPPVTVVIPSYEAAPYLRACVSALRAFSPSRARIAIVDNASGPAVQGYLDELDGTSGVRIVRNTVNAGFTYAVNQGIELAEPGDDIVILNNDALVTPGWLDALQRVALERADVGMVAPAQVLFPGTATLRTHVPGADDSRECDANLSAHHRNVIDPTFDERRGWVELDYAPFFCVLVPRRALERCGPLDHVHAPHYRSDRVYCDAVRMHAGLRIVYTPDAKVYHFHERSTEDLHRADERLAKAMRTSQGWDAIVGLQERPAEPASKG